MDARDPGDGEERGPRVLVILDTGAAWSRGILRGFVTAANECNWTLLHYHTHMDVGWLADEWAPAAAVVGPELSADSLARLSPATLVSMTVDRSAQGVASVCVDDEAIATLALRHLLDTGLRQLSTFRYDQSEFAVARERTFVAGARAAGARVAAGWGSDGTRHEERIENPTAILQWLRQLPKPCGIFTCTDSWGSTVGRYARAAGLRVPEDLALVGADNDVLECELILPPLSSVMLPWQELGRSAAQLVQRALSGESIAGAREVLSPIAVIGRRSSDVFAVSDPLVVDAVRWIRDNAGRRVTVDMVARAMGGGRKRLERRFRAALGRTVHGEIRRAHVDLAKGLLQTTGNDLVHVAKNSGFTNAALLSVSFQREVGMPPGLYRRRIQRQLRAAGND